jgi:hypothetical protein
MNTTTTTTTTTLNILKSAAYVATHPFKVLYEYTIWRPLLRLYRLGPSWSNWGFWRNATDAAVCEQLTGVANEFWRAHSDQCVARIEQEFSINMVVIETLLYLFVLYKVYIQVAHHAPALLASTRKIVKVESEQ